MIKYLLAGILFISHGFPAFPQNRIVVLKDDKDSYFISEYLQHFCDTTNQLTIKEISSGRLGNHFSAFKNPYIDHPYSGKNHWIRFTISNQRSNENQSWYFESWGYNIDEIEFYVPDKTGNFIRTSMGYYKDFSERNYYHKNFLFYIDLRPGEEATYYVKCKKKYPMHLIFHVRTGERFVEHAIIEYWGLGLFYGVFIFIILINLYLFLRLKEKIYLLYLFCLVSEVLYCLGRDGLGFQFIWPTLPALNELTHHNITQFLLIISTLIYAIHFLSLKKEQLWMYKITLAAIGLKSVLFLLFFVYELDFFYIFTIDTFLLAIPFVAGIISLRKGNKFVSYYVVAFSCLFMSFLLIFLNENKLIPYTDFNWYFINIGMLLEGIFLALALISQVKTLREKNEEAQQKILQQYKDNELLKDKVNQELELKVQQRTDEIQKLLTELEQKNKKLLMSNQELETLSERVREMNTLLYLDNEKLKTDLTEINTSRILQKDVNFEEFQKVFTDENACLKFLADLKWKQGYKCRKCGYNKSSNSKTTHGKRCKNCNYDESPTTQTLFHKLKFPITKAFYMVYLISQKDQKLSLDEISEMLSLRKETCWSFRQKIRTAKKNLEDKGIKNAEADGWDALTLISIEK